MTTQKTPYVGFWNSKSANLLKRKAIPIDLVFPFLILTSLL